MHTHSPQQPNTKREGEQAREGGKGRVGEAERERE